MEVTHCGLAASDAMEVEAVWGGLAFKSGTARPELSARLFLGADVSLARCCQSTGAEKGDEEG